MSYQHIMLGFEVECEVRSRYDSDRLFAPIQNENKNDCSLDCYSNGFETREVTTVPIKYKSSKMRYFFDELARLVDSDTIRVNDTCGLHVHISFPYHIWDKIDTPMLIAWQDMVRQTYPDLYSERSTHSYCEPWREREVATTSGSRYRSINLTSAYAYGTLECRFYGGHDHWSVAEYESFVRDTVEYFRACLKPSKAKKVLESIMFDDTAPMQNIVIAV